MSIGERITDLRKVRDLSQAQLAKLMGVSRQAISKWENDTASPDTLNLIRLAEVLQSDIAYLATGEAAAPTPEPVVMTVVKEVEKPVEVIKEVEVEIPVIKRVEVEKLVEVERVVEVEKPIIRRRIRVKYRNNPIHMLILGVGCFILGLILGLIF